MDERRETNMRKQTHTQRERERERERECFPVNYFYVKWHVKILPHRQSIETMAVRFGELSVLCGQKDNRRW